MGWRILLACAFLAPAALGAQEHGRGGFMGIGFEWSDDDAREARVGQVVPGSGAERAGVRPGDVVLRIDGEPATRASVDALRGRLAVGDTVRMRLRRGDRELDQAVVTGDAPDRHVYVFGGGDDEVIRLQVPQGEMRLRMDTLRLQMERLRGHMDSLRGRLEILHGDSAVTLFRVGPEGHGFTWTPGGGREIRILRRDSLGGGRDSVIIVRDSVWGTPLRALERIEIPRFDLDPDVPFYMELGRRGVGGAELAEMNPGLARYFRTDDGVLVLEVSEDAPMARAGVEAGDVIVRAGEAPVRSVGDLRRAMAESREGKLRLELVRQGSRRTVEMAWEPFRWRTVPEGERVRERQERTRARQERERSRQERERSRN